MVGAELRVERTLASCAYKKACEQAKRKIVAEGQRILPSLINIPYVVKTVHESMAAALNSPRVHDMENCFDLLYFEALSGLR